MSEQASPKGGSWSTGWRQKLNCAGIDYGCGVSGLPKAAMVNWSKNHMRPARVANVIPHDYPIPFPLRRIAGHNRFSKGFESRLR